ncbi:MAG: sulfotransferase domain-containing protein [Bacteroidota bacterium]
MLNNLMPDKTPYYRIRFSYRKCLTHYMNAIFDKNKFYNRKRKPFVKHLEKQKRTRFISINNNVFWPGRKIFKNAKMIHLIRHPKDIIISGYFYHKKGSELWNTLPIRRPHLYCLSFELDDVYNEQEKKLLNPEITYQQLLENLSFEKGMMTEIVWVKYVHTFNPIPFYESPLIQTFRFENIVEEPVKKIEEICRYWELSDQEIEYYCQRAAHFDKTPNYKIRDRSAYQYQKYFDDTLNLFYKKHFGNVVRRLEYPD